MVLNFFAKRSKIQTYNIVRGSDKRNFNASQLTPFYFIAERSLLYKILESFLKDCWGPHKRCLGAACGSQNSGRVPLL